MPEEEMIELLTRIKDQEQHRAEGVVLFRDCLIAMDEIAKLSPKSENHAIRVSTIGKLNQYLKNIIEFNEKQDELLQDFSDLATVEEMSN